ncbi:LAMP1 protein, partial [Anhinga rufa]|nr:LAMP1 protein [Anhinga rufa]
QFAHFFLPQNATVEPQSSCGKSNTSHPILVLGFGAGHSLSLNFSERADKYQCNLFTGEEKTVSHKTTIQAYMGTKYRCISPNRVNMKNVNITFSNVTLEAYVINGTLSTN